MKKFSVGIIIVLFLGFVFVVGAQNTIKPPAKVTPASEPKPDLRIPTLKQIPLITPQPESGVGLQVPTLDKPSTIIPLPEQRPNLIVPSLEQIPSFTPQDEFKPELRIPSLDKSRGVSSLPEQKPTLTIPQLQGIPSFAPQPERRPIFTVPQLHEISPVTSSLELKPTLSVPQLPAISSFTPQPESTPQLQLFALRELPPVQGLRDTEYGYFKLSDFSGGLNKRDFPTEIADNEVTELTNFVWEGKKIRPRDGFTTYYDMSEVGTNKRVWGLYRYYKQDGSKILLLGQDATFYTDTNTSGNFVSVKTGLQSNSKYYYFDTFKDKAIVAHEGDYPFWYDGDTTNFIGIIHSELVGHQGSCSDPYITVPTKQAFGEDSLVGAIIFFDQGTNDWQGEFITSNKSGGLEWDTIWTNPQAQVGFTNDPYEIYLLWEYQDTIASGTLDDSINWGDWGCDFWVFDASANFPSLCKQKYVLKLTSGTYEGTARFTYCPAPLSYDSTKAIHIAGPESDTVKFRGGPDYAIIKVGFPKARIVKIYKNRVFLIDETKDVIYFSSYNDYNTFGPDNYFAVKTQGGDHITALATFYDDQLGYKDQSKDFLGIFKENSIWKLIWNSATDYYLVQVVEGVGCVAPKSIVNVEGKYLLFFHTTGVYAFDGRTVTLVSAKIDPFIENFQPTQLDHIVGAYYDRHYYLTYARVGEGLNRYTLVFNIDLGVWAETNNIWTSLFCQQNALSDTCKLLFAHISKSLIYRFGITATDTGQPISLILKSKAFNLGDLHKRKRFTYFDFDYYLDSDSVKVWFYTDFGDNLRYSAYVNESGGNRHARISLDADCLGRNFSFKLTSDKWFELGSVAFKFREIGE